jgi:hypothetical protein
MKKLITFLTLILMVASIHSQTTIQLNIENQGSGANLGILPLEIGGTFYVSKFELKAKKENTPSSGGIFTYQEGVDFLINQSSFSSLDWAGYVEGGGWNGDGTGYELKISDAVWQSTTYKFELQPFNSTGDIGSPIMDTWDNFGKTELTAGYKAEGVSTPYDSTTASKWKAEGKVKMENPSTINALEISTDADSMRVLVKDINDAVVFTFVYGIDWVNPLLFGLNVNTEVANPTNSNFFDPTEDFVSTVELTNDNGDILDLRETNENKVEKMEIWISGPKNNYKHVPGLDGLKIVEKYIFDDSLGFDATTNALTASLEDTMNLEAGTYTMLIKAKRKGFGTDVEKIQLTDFQVKTTDVSEYFPEQWATTCNDCRKLEKHGATELPQCAVCHNQSLVGVELVRIVHNDHSKNSINACETCHTNSDGNDTVFIVACESCHDGTNAGAFPSGHEAFTDATCIGCHGSGDLSPDAAHADITSIDNKEVSPTNYELYQNYPNPFNPSTTIKFSIVEQSQVTLKVYDILGEVVSTLVNDVMPSGTFNVNFNGSNLSSGIYFYKLETNNYTATKKLLLIK